MTNPLRTVRSLYERVTRRLERGVMALERRYTPLGRFTPGPFEGWGFLWQPTLLGFLGMCLVFVGGTIPRSPFKLNLAGTWFFGEPPSSPTTFPSETRLLLAVVLTYGGLLLLMRVWLRLAEVVKIHGGATVKSLWWMLVIWATPMLVAPPMFSRDVYSYACLLYTSDAADE